MRQGVRPKGKDLLLFKNWIQNFSFFLIFLFISSHFYQVNADAGFGAAAKCSRFYVTRPIALHREDDDSPKDDVLFVGYDSDFIFCPDGIEFSEASYRVSKVKNYEVFMSQMVFGQTWDEKWYILTIEPEIKAEFLNDENAWREKLKKLGGPSSFSLQTFDDGYKKYKKEAFFYSLFWFFGSIGLISFPWIIILYIQSGRHQTEMKKIKNELSKIKT